MSELFQRVEQVRQENQRAILAAIEALTKALSAPREIIRDKSGRPVASVVKR